MTIFDASDRLARHTPEQLGEILCRPSWPTTPVADPDGRYGVYVVVFSEPADGKIKLPPEPAFESSWRELARLIPTPNTYERWLEGTVLDERWDLDAEDVAAVLADVPPVVLVEVYSPVAVIPAGRLASRLVLMTDPDTRAAAVDWCRRVVRDDPTPGAWLVKQVAAVDEHGPDEGQAAEHEVDDPAAAVLAAAADVVGTVADEDPDAWWMREDEPKWED